MEDLKAANCIILRKNMDAHVKIFIGMIVGEKVIMFPPTAPYF